MNQIQLSNCNNFIKQIDEKLNSLISLCKRAKTPKLAYARLFSAMILILRKDTSQLKQNLNSLFFSKHHLDVYNFFLDFSSILHNAQPSSWFKSKILNLNDSETENATSNDEISQLHEKFKDLLKQHLTQFISSKNNRSNYNSQMVGVIIRSVLMPETFLNKKSMASHFI